jgi:hypothetical protein
MILTGDLGAFDPAFRGWKLREGKLISPEGWEATPAISCPSPCCGRRSAPIRPSSG